MSIFTAIKTQLSILDVISEHVTLKRTGHYYKGCCPFHHEKTASFTVSPDKQIFYCFGCHIGGDVISFISHVERCSQLEAAKVLADRYQLTIPEAFTYAGDTHTDGKKKYFDICHHVVQWCHKALMKNPAVLRYLYGRGIDKACIIYFDVGYFPGGITAIKSLLSYMNKHYLLADDLLEAHILSKGKTALYSPFEQRIIFPIKDHLKHYCGFGGRIYKKHDKRAKYYNSRENEYFNKGSLLYGLDLAKESMQKTGEAFLVEGYTDCIAMVQHGYKNTVAVLGTACSLDHLKQIARYIDRIYIVYDSDKAGQQAILRLTELCWQVNLELKVILLPPGEDPASCLMKQIDLKQKIHKAEDIFLFFIKTIGADFAQKPLNQKLQLIHRIINIIANLADPLKQDILLQQAAKTIGIPFQTLKNELRRQPKTSAASTLKSHDGQILTENIANNSYNSLPKLEKKIFSAILNNASLLTKLSESYKQVIYRFLPAPLPDILKRLNTIQHDQPESSFNVLFEELDDSQKQLISQILIMYYEPTKEQDFLPLLTQLQKKYWKIIVNEIKIKLEAAKQENNTKKIKQLIDEFSAFKRMMLQHE